MLLRLAKKEEIEAITNISIDAFYSDSLIGLDINNGPPGYDSVKWHKKMQEEKHLFTYLCDNETIIGAAIIFSSIDEIYIGRIFISPKYQRIGYGIALMNEIEKMFSVAKKFKLDTPIINNRTNSFYKKLGYVKTNVVDDCVIYTKEISH